MEPVSTTSSQGLQADLNVTLQKPGVTYVLNGRPEAGAEGSYLWSNEPANELAFILPGGKQVVHTLRITELRLTLLFLAGSVSEIGIVSHDLKPEPYTNSDVGPIEANQEPVGTYSTLLVAPCLNFSIHQVLEAKYQFEQTDFYLYLVDNKNADRIIRFELINNQLVLHPDSKVIDGYDDCNAPIYRNELDCNRSRLDALGGDLTITAASINTGGSWEAGTVQVRAAYCTATGERLTEFLTQTTPIKLWETPLSTRAGVTTNQAITIDVNSTSSTYTYIQLGIIQIIGSQVQTFTLPPYSVKSKTIVLQGNETRLPLSLGELLETRTHYTSSAGLTTTEQRLLRWGLTEKQIPNFQKYLLEIPVNWQTIQLEEGAYKDGIIAGKFVSFMRGEVVPLGLVLEYFDGDESGVFSIPGRTAFSTELTEIVSDDSVALQEVKKNTKPVLAWEVQDTGSVVSRPHMAYKSADEPGIWELGLMGYHESTLVYPNRPDVWGDLCNKPIRHHKFPSNNLTHIHDGYSATGELIPLTKKKGYIYPIGFLISSLHIKDAIALAERDGILQPGVVSGYRIVRGDRTGQASILARGLLYDVNSYQRKGQTVEFSNYPFNDLRPDPFLSPTEDTYKNYRLPALRLPFTKTGNYTFHSPDTHFSPQGRADYVKLETEEYGQSEGSFQEAKDQAKQKLTSSDILGAAYTLGYNEALPTISIGGSDPLLLLVDGLGKSVTFKQLFESLLPFKNLGVYYQAVGWYNQWNNAPQPGFRIRSINQQVVLEPDIQQVNNVIVNNRFREKSTYLQLNQAGKQRLPSPRVTDRSRFLLSETELDKNETRSISAWYGSLVRYNPTQYGRISGVSYLETGNRFKLDTFEEVIQVFGGDTYINRFSLKRKHSFFTQTRFNLPDKSSVIYSDLANVAYPNYFFDTEFTDKIFDGVFPSLVGRLLTIANQQVPHRLDKGVNNPLQADGSMFLYSYGIPYFFCESSVNLDMREAGNLTDEAFYPLVDTKTWTQENNVSINKDNVYRYDRSYSRPIRENKLLPFLDSQLYNQLRDQYHPNRVIYSQINNWRHYKALNYYDFDRLHGLLTGLNGLQGNRVLARFEHGAALFNAYSTLPVGEELVQIDSGGMFAQRPQQFAQVDGGAIGSQDRSFCSTPFGNVWVDQIRGGIYLMAPGGNPEPLHANTPIEHWLQDNLPSFIKRQYPSIALGSLPIQMIYDPTSHRILITKRDYSAKRKDLIYSGKDGVFLTNNGEQVLLGNPQHFVDCSFTIGYHFPTKQWAFYSFNPDYLVSWPKGFLSLINSPTSRQKGSGWVHRNSRLQYQHFFGQQVPFELSVWTGYTGQAVQLESVEFGCEVRRYHQGDQFTVLDTKTYDKLVVSSDRQTSGVVDLIPGTGQNPRELLLNRPRVYQTIGGNWSVNGIVDKTASNNVLPLWITDSTRVKKFVNNEALRTSNGMMTSSLLRGTGFTIHFKKETNKQDQYLHQFVSPVLKPA